MNVEALKSGLQKHFSVARRPIHAKVQLFKGDTSSPEIKLEGKEEAVKFLSQLMTLDAAEHKEASDKVLAWVETDWQAGDSPTALQGAGDSPAASLSASSERSGLVASWRWNDAGALGENSYLAKRNPVRQSSNLPIPAICKDIPKYLRVTVRVTNGDTFLEKTFKDVPEAIGFIDSEPICRDGDPKVEWKWA